MFNKKRIQKIGFKAYHSMVDGSFIGEDTMKMCLKIGLEQVQNYHNDGKCSANIGFNKKQQKWYGWSHRAIGGFKIGDIVKDGDSTASSGWTEEYLKEHPEENLSLPVGFEAKTLEDCKKMAIAFAESVS